MTLTSPAAPVTVAGVLPAAPPGMPRSPEPGFAETVLLVSLGAEATIGKALPPPPSGCLLPFFFLSPAPDPLFCSRPAALGTADIPTEDAAVPGTPAAADARVVGAAAAILSMASPPPPMVARGRVVSTGAGVAAVVTAHSEPTPALDGLSTFQMRDQQAQKKHSAMQGREWDQVSTCTRRCGLGRQGYNERTNANTRLARERLFLTK